MVTTVGLGYEAQLVDQVLQWRTAGSTAWTTVDSPVTAAKFRLDGGGTYVRLQYIGDWSYNGGTGPTGGAFVAPASAISPSFTATRGGSNTDWTSQLTAADILTETTAAKNLALTFLDHLDFARLEARNMVTHRLATPPISPTIGQAYYDTGLSKKGVWNGYQWDYGISDDRPIGTLNYGVSLRGYEPIIIVTATKTLAMADSGTLQNCTNTAAAVITIPLNTNVAFPIGCRIIVQKTTAQTVTIAWASGVTVLNSSGATLTVTGVTSSTILRKTDTDVWIAFPDLPESAIGGALRVAVDAPTAKATIGLSAVTNVPLIEIRSSIQVGTSAGSSNTSGTGFSAIGTSSGQDVTTGSSNTTIGFNTGRGITTGSGNTVVGAGVTGLAATLTNNVILASGDGVIKLQVDSTGLTTLPISPAFSDNSTLVATTAHVKNVLLNSPSITGATLLGTVTVGSSATLSVPTVALGNVSLQAANTTQVARSCRPIVIVSRTTAFTFTTTYTDLIFNNTIRNNSSAYNTTTGVFTAPYAGIYSFSCHVANFAGVSTFTLVGVGSAANTEALRLGLSATTGSFQVVAASQLVFMNSGNTRRFGVQVGGTNAAGSPEASTTAQTSCYMSIEYLGIDT